MGINIFKIFNWGGGGTSLDIYIYNQGSSLDEPGPFCEKTINVLLKWTLFLAGPHIQAIQISCQLSSNVDIKDSWGHQKMAH